MWAGCSEGLQLSRLPVSCIERVEGVVTHLMVCMMN